MIITTNLINIIIKAMHLITIPFKIRKYLAENSLLFLEKNIFLRNKLFLDYNEIENLINDRSDQSLKTLYFNKENIENILYDSDRTILIDDIKLEKFSDLFYLELLLTDNPDILNYTFSGKIIPALYEKLNTITECPKKVITSKILIDLIESYKGFCEEEEKIGEENLEKMTEKCKDKIKEEIKNNEVIYKSYEYIKEQSIDKIYMNFFIQLIKSENLNFDDVYNMIKCLEFGELNITENMYQDLKDFINIKENNAKKFFIEKIEDLININKIHFYYIILKYILKNRLFLYQFQFLLNTRKLLIDIINNNLYTLIVIAYELHSSLSEKLEFLIKIITDSEYYLNKYIQMKEKVKEIVKNEQLRYIYQMIPILIDISGIDDILSKVDIIIQKWEIYYQLIKGKKFNKIRKPIKNKLLEYFKEEKNKYLLLKIFTNGEIESFKNLEINNDNEMEEEEKEKKEELKEEEEKDEKDNIDNEQDNIDPEQYEDKQKSNQNLDLINEDFSKNNECGTSMYYQTYTIRDEETTEANTEMLNKNLMNIDLKMFTKSDKFQVTEPYKSIEKKGKTEAFFNFSKKLSKGHYITGLNSEKITLYNAFYEEKLVITIFDKLRNVYELEHNNNPDIINLIACCKNQLVEICINIRNYSFKHYTISKGKNINYSSCYKINNNDYFIIGEKGGFTLNRKNPKKTEKKFCGNYTGGIKINKNVYGFTSNKLIPQGDDRLIIYDFDSDNLLKEINDDYTFGFTSNGLCLFDGNKIKSINENRQILLCSCKKEKKHGFLVLNMNLEKGDKKFNEFFYETKNFEPSCICQLSNVENDNSITDDITDEQNIEVEDTEFFVVGGFDPDKRIGVLKLYKLQYDKDHKNIIVKYLIDIETEDGDDDNSFEGFDTNITCITQSKIAGNLLINSLDGNIHLFKRPNLDVFTKK